MRARAGMRMHFQNLNLWGTCATVCCGRIQSAECVWWARDATDAHAPSSVAACMRALRRITDIDAALEMSGSRALLA